MQIIHKKRIEEDRKNSKKKILRILRI